MTDTVKDLENRLAAATEVRQQIDAMNALAWEVTSSNLPCAFSLSEEVYTLVAQDKQEAQLYEKGDHQKRSGNLSLEKC
jgi:hypothetical protein